MVVRFRGYHNGEPRCAEAERADIFAVGDSSLELIKNVNLAARVHYDGLTAAGEFLHIILANEAGAGG